VVQYDLTFESLFDDPLIRLVRASDHITEGEFFSLMQGIRGALNRRAAASSQTPLPAPLPCNVLAFRPDQSVRGP
jgi:hypothetical protein